MTKLEQVARAICRNSSHAPNGTCAAICMEQLGDAPAKGCRHAVRIHGGKARAAVEALREPSEEMIDEGHRCSGWDLDRVAEPVWQAMIDAILEEVE